MASSMAESPPPITAMGLLRKMGAAPSHTAQAEMPLFQKPVSSSEPLKGSRLATAPVAMMSVCAVTSFSSVHSLKGRRDRSTLSTVSVKMRVPKRRLCSRNLQKAAASAAASTAGK
jgi:hypothetical protein